MPIDGLASGLDTSSIISQLMSLERRPRTQLAARRDTVKAGLDALGTIRSRLTAITDAAAALQRPSGWSIRSATSTQPTVATVSASNGAAAGELTFTVDRLAARHVLTTASAVPDASTVIASGGSVTLTVGGDPHVLAVGGGTLAEVADAVNQAGIGIIATVVGVGSGVRLQLAASTTGAASAFSVSGIDGAGGMSTTVDAADAQITIGSGLGAYAVTSATNRFDGLLAGTAVTVQSVSTAPVTIRVGADRAGLANRVADLVAAVNSAISEMRNRTAYDPATRKAASLAGDTAVRRVTQQLVTAVTEAVTQSTLGSAGRAGLSVDRTGMLTFDRAAFEAAYDRDPAGVERLFVQGATTTGTVRFAGAGDLTRSGTYAVEVTRLPTTASITGLDGTWPLDEPRTVVVRRGPAEVTYTIGTDQSAADAAAGLGDALAAAGIPITVDEAGGGLRLTAEAPGSRHAFEVAWDGVTFTPAAAVDVAGTIDGVEGTGAGWTLVVTADRSSVTGLGVDLTGSTLGPAGTISYQAGVAQRIATAVADALRAEGGVITGASESRQRSINAIDRALEAYDRRLAQREAALRREYAQLETVLGRLKDQSNWLTSQLRVFDRSNRP
jgi:flagellar hook-associated protein 2